MLVGKYRLDARLGGGGMAEVFAGSTIGVEGFTRKVAIKRVLPGFSEDPEFAKMFVAEAKISSRLIHPNIVSTIDFDRDDEQRLFLVMELVDGKNLDALAGTGLLPFNALIYVAVEVLRGLGYAHDLPMGNKMRGVVHRDVSPHNVLLSWEGAVKVSDFGIAKARDASAATASTLIKGKPAYMSPEQANGEALDGRSDLFAFGVMLWELLVGRRLFVAEDTRGTLAAVLFGKIPRPRSVRPEVPKDLERIVMKLLERDMPARYPAAEVAIAELLKCADVKGGRDALIGVMGERFAKDAPVRKNRSSPKAAAVTPPHEMPTVANRSRETAQRPKSRKWLVVVALGAIAASAGAYAVMSMMHRGNTAVAADAEVVSTAPVRKSGEGWFRVGEIEDVAFPIDASFEAAVRPDAKDEPPPIPKKLTWDQKYIPPKCVPFMRELESAAKCRSDLASLLESYKEAILSHSNEDPRLTSATDMARVETQCGLALERLRKEHAGC